MRISDWSSDVCSSDLEKIQVGVLGSLGVALLFWSAISLIQKVESSFNFVWRIERPRPLHQRLGDYLAVLTVGPVLMFAAVGITASIFNSTVVTELSNRSEEHTSELQSLMRNSYAVFCLKK